MTKFERFALPQGVAEIEIEAALEAAFRTLRLDVPGCELIGDQTNTLVEVVVHPSEKPTFRFKVALEDVVARSLAGKIDAALRAAAATPEVM